MSFSRKVAFRYLWAKRSEAFITIITVISILGVAIGVGVLNITMSIMTGFEKTLKEKIVGANSHILVRTVGGRITEWQSIQELLTETEGVVDVSPFTYNQALLKVEGHSVGILLRGIRPSSGSANELAKDVPNYPEALEELFAPPPTEITDEKGIPTSVVLPGIVLGRELMRSSQIRAGDIVSVLSPRVSSTPLGLVPKFRRFRVVGEYHSGLIEYESGVGYVALDEAQRFFRMGDTVSGFEVRVANLAESRAIAQKISDSLNTVGQLFAVQDWTELNKPLWDAIRLEKRVYFIVLLLIVVMASFSIISTLIMIVLEKRKDIAVLKTLGASSKAISFIFVTQGAIIGAVGTLLGLALGYCGCRFLQVYGFPLDERIFQMSTVPVRMEPLNFFLVGVCAFLICLLATIYPSRRASKLEPSDMLRYS